MCASDRSHGYSDDEFESIIKSQYDPEMADRVLGKLAGCPNWHFGIVLHTDEPPTKILSTIDKN